MKPLLTLPLILFLGSVARADMMPWPFQHSAVSADSDYIARLDFSRPSEGPKKEPDSLVSIHRYDSTKREFTKFSEFPYGEKVGSGFLFISNGGKYVVAVNVGFWIGQEKLGIRLYNQTGKLLKFWPVSDFLTPEEARACPMTGSTLQWFQSGSFNYDVEKFQFSVPTIFLPRESGSSNAAEETKKEWRLSSNINLKTLALKRLFQEP